MFHSLPSEQQPLVQKGQIQNGMSADAVFLAWGSPASRELISDSNGLVDEVWIYTRLEPVMVDNAWRGPGWGPWGLYDPMYDVYPSTAYVPRKVAQVNFNKGKVVSWSARISSGNQSNN